MRLVQANGLDRFEHAQDTVKVTHGDQEDMAIWLTEPSQDLRCSKQPAQHHPANSPTDRDRFDASEELASSKAQATYEALTELMARSRALTCRGDFNDQVLHTTRHQSKVVQVLYRPNNETNTCRDVRTRTL